MAAAHAILAETPSQKPPQQLKQYSLQECTVLFLDGV
jgi:hypothetical protein